MFRKAAASPKDETSATHSPTEITIQEILEPKAPNLRENQLSGTHCSQCKEVDPEFQPGNPADVQENHGYHKGC